ncbi:TPA: cyclic di-GMP phosphodiesterase [Klebsiella pneumoniae]|nr:cyclic di-GMP phosphodiesterase [Klebsiella pneumoniae]HBS4051116.1 cyclic di-GMP phosphodiesterase [Klebsiella pneumoniae]
MLTRYFSPQRKTWLTSLSVGIIVALLAGSIQFMVIYHNRAERFDAIINNVNTYLKSYFHDLRQTIDGLQPLVDQPCENIDSGLTSHAAFSPNVRAFLLVKNGIAFCSSATGAMNTPLSQLIPAIDISKPVAMAILPGTPMMPKSAALALWVGKPGDQNSGIFVSINANLTPYILYSARQNDFSGIALAIDHTAISTFSNRLVDPQTLHNAPIRQAQIEGLPLKVYLYANSWLAENTQFALLLGVVCGLLAGLLCYYVLTIKSDPRKSILLGIKNNQFYIVYQPVVNAQTLRISGVEVLMRWRHPVVGEIPPDVFINLAETQQMIVPLTHHLLALIYLERYNFDYLKIDRGFVQAIGTETVTSPVLDAVLTLSRRLKLMTVAEGVETQEQAEWLRGQGVHFLQGYWISRPLSLAGLVAAHDEPANYFTTR